MEKIFISENSVLKFIYMQRYQLMWSIILALTCTYSAIETPLDFIFTFNHSSTYIVFHCFLSIIFIYDTYLTIKEDRVRINEEHLLVSSHKKMNTFTKGFWFPIHILASMPFEIVYLIPMISNNFGLIKLVRMLLLFKIFKKLKHLHVPKYFRLILIFIAGAVTVHFITCFWLYLNPTPELGAVSSYIRAFYWSITTLTTTGYGDITPQTDAGKIFNVFVMLIGFSAFGLIIGQISNLIMSNNRHNEANRQKMDDLKLFMNYYQVPESIREEIFTFYNHMMTKRLSDNDSKIISELPTVLQNELQVYMKIKLISNLPIFHELNFECLKEVALNLKQVFFSAGDVIIKTGDHGNEMYIIDHGELEVIGAENKIFAKLSHGQCFGEIALLLDMTRMADVRATTYCDLYKLEKTDFKRLIVNYPELEINFNKIMRKRTEDKK